MEIEASIPPSKIRLDKLCRNYSLRIIKLNPNHIIRKRVSPTFPPIESGEEIDWQKYLDWNEDPLNLNKRVPSQLYKICSMIKEEFSHLNVEKINFDLLAPWKTPLKSLINI
jgi:hypothetical protein